jgi:hypothetical protein
MNAAQSLRASADAYLRQGNEVDASFCARMAEDAQAFGCAGNALYRHWANEQAERVTRLEQAS